MLARVFDSSTNTYFKSKVYAKINGGWYEQQLVLVPDANGAYFKLFDFLDKSNPEKAIPLINLITSNSDGENWEFRRSGSVDKHLEDFEGLLESDIRFFEFHGYPWVFEDKAMILELLKGGMVALKGSRFEDKISDYKLDGWNYVEMQQDIDFIMEQTCSFHDSILVAINYISGGYVDESGGMYCTDNTGQVTMIFHSQWCQPIEMVFEGVTALNLRPASDNYSADIFEASLFVENASLFFCDTGLDKIDPSYEGTWIMAYGMRWRFNGGAHV
ncbi:MAG: hypothetical protein FWB74_00910 [Defluviitaleaceae bacterium]|nr:hypothetical protein [Defluviitaleaceae bacterium]